MSSFKNPFKKEILRSDEDTLKSLDNASVEKINNVKRKAVEKKEMQDAIKQLNKTNTDIEISKMDDETDRIKAETEQLPAKIENMEGKEIVSRAERKIKFNAAVGENRNKEIPEYKKRANQFRKLSLVLSAASAVTSCYGLWYEAGCAKPDAMLKVSFAVMIAISVALNIVLNNFVVIKKKFINMSDKLDLIMISIMSACVVSCTGYSIFTNYLFWSSVNKNTISSGLYACILDVFAIAFCLMTYKYDTLDFSKKYLDEINEIGDVSKFEENKKLVDDTQENVIESPDVFQKNEVTATQQTQEKQCTDLVVQQENIADVININDSKKKEDEIEKKTNLKV